MNKYGNTVKMMGASPRVSLEFADACHVLGTYINQELKTKARRTILGTVVMGKTMRDWLKHFAGKELKEFNLSRLEMNNVDSLVNLVCQEYYRREKVL